MITSVVAMPKRVTQVARDELRTGLEMREVVVQDDVEMSLSQHGLEFAIAPVAVLAWN